MESWLFFAIISLFFAGGYNFAMKVISQRNYNTSFVSIISYFIASIFSGLYYIFTSLDNFQIDGLLIIILLASGNTLFYFFSTLSRVESLNNIDTTIFFPLYKTVSPIFITLISLFFFGDNLNLKETFGIIVGIIVPLLLITKAENKIQKNLKLGLILIVITSIFTSISSSFSKGISTLNLDIELFVFFSLFIGTIISAISYKFFDKKHKKNYSKKGIYKFGIILGFFHFMSFLCFTKAATGNLAIVYTINSFSILIPIILSVIFYKEEMTFKKGFVIFLSVISMLLFI